MHYVNTAFNFLGNCLLEKGKYVVIESSYFKGAVKFSKTLRRIAHKGGVGGWGGGSDRFRCFFEPPPAKRGEVKILGWG